MTVSELVSHNHAITDPGHIHAITDPGHAHKRRDGAKVIKRCHVPATPYARALAHGVCESFIARSIPWPCWPR